MHEAFYRAIWNEIRYLSKIRGTYNVLRTSDYRHFFTYTFGKLNNYLTKEIGKRTLTIHHCPISPIMAFKTDEYIKSQQLSANVCKSYCSNLHYKGLSIIICVNYSFQFVTRCYLYLIYWVPIFELKFFLELHLNRHHFRPLQIKVN